MKQAKFGLLVHQVTSIQHLDEEDKGGKVGVDFIKQNQSLVCKNRHKDGRNL